MADPAQVQRDYWEERGPVWVQHRRRLDMMLEPLGEAAMSRLLPDRGEQILDVGCGTGTTTLALAELVGPGGGVTGVDVSATMLAEARRRAAQADVGYVEFVEADAGSFAFAPRQFDAAFSRMGVMFFADPVAAFTNIRRTLRPDGRLGLVCWRSQQENPWATEPARVMACVLGAPPLPPVEGPGPFSLGSREQLWDVLTRAGFKEVDITAHDQPVSVGDGSDDELVRFFLDLPPAANLPERPDERLLDRLKASLAAMVQRHRTLDGVMLGAAAWIVSGRA